MEIIYISTKDRIDEIIDDTPHGIVEINLNKEEYDEVLFGLNKHGSEYPIVYPTKEGGSFQYRDVYFHLKEGV